MLDVLLNLLRELRFYIAWKKVVSLSTVVTYLGIQLESELMQVRVEALLRNLCP